MIRSAINNENAAVPIPLSAQKTLQQSAYKKPAKIAFGDLKNTIHNTPAAKQNPFQKTPLHSNKTIQSSLKKGFSASASSKNHNAIDAIQANLLKTPNAPKRKPKNKISNEITFFCDNINYGDCSPPHYCHSDPLEDIWSAANDFTDKDIEALVDFNYDNSDSIQFDYNKAQTPYTDDLKLLSIEDENNLETFGQHTENYDDLCVMMEDFGLMH